ncbi:MAG: ABC transporter permease [Oscillospiraceae bacterium]|nr:ABC transporter permease [Oscillospiraceae bacterium]
MTVFTTTLKRILKQPLNWVFIMVFPILCYVLVSMSTGGETQNDATTNDAFFGIVDNDNSVLSKTLANQLGLRYNIKEVDESDIAAQLTNQLFPCVILIKEGYERDVMTRNTALDSLESYSLTISDVSVMGKTSAENITRALMILGTNNEQILSQWEETSRLEVTVAAVNDNWVSIAQWLSMFGYISIFTAYFVIKTLLDDKKLGMPDRVGVLPIHQRNYLTQSTLAAFLVTEITVVLTLVSLWLVLGTIPNVIMMFVLLSLFNLFSVSLVLSITSIAKSLAGASIAMVMIATLTAMLGGLFWPLELVPALMKKIAWFTPGYWFGEGLRNVRDITFEGFVMPLLFLAGFTIVTLLIGGIKKVQRMED